MAGTRTSHSRGDYVTAALAIIDEQGLAGLTTRSLGDRLGVHGTAVYRHFQSIDELVDAVLNEVIGQIADAPETDAGTPRERLTATMVATRLAFAEHPNIIVPFLSSTGLFPRGSEITLRVLADLAAMGLRGRELAEALQMLESFLIGSIAFDYAGAPEHLEIRRVRRRMLAHEAFDPLTRNPEQIGELNEAAFALGCIALLDMCEKLAST